MARWICYLLNAAALLQSALANNCASALEGVGLMAKLGNPEAVDALMIMAASTGKMLPMDSGKFTACLSRKDAATFATKHFLLDMNVAGTAVQLGLCLPADCKNEDFHDKAGLDAIRNAIGNKALQNVTIDIPTYHVGTFPQPPGTVNFPNPSNTIDNIAPWGLAATLGTSAIALLALMAGVSTAVILYAETARVGRTQSDAEVGANARGEMLLNADIGNDAACASTTTSPQTRHRAFSAKTVADWKILQAWNLLGAKGSWTDLWKVGRYQPTDCLNGMRVISMFWIVIGHTMFVYFAGMSNPEDVGVTPLNPNAAETHWWFQFLLCADFLSVDTFFFISGFLLAYTGQRKDEQVATGTITRYLRLVPSIAVTTLLQGFIAPYMVFGPLGARLQHDMVRKCENYWWTNIAFIMEFYPIDSEMCGPHLWYLGLDLMFYVVGLILLNIWKKPRLSSVAWVLLATIITVGTGYSWYLTQQHHLGSYAPTSHNNEMHYLYQTPWHRIPAFLVGLALPWAMDAAKKRGVDRDTIDHNNRLTKCMVLLAAVAAVATMVILIVLPVTNYPGGPGSTRTGDNWSQFSDSLYVCFSRMCWALCCGVVALACFYDYLPVVNAILAHWIWKPMAKLTFGAYLLHPIIIGIFFGNSSGFQMFSVAAVISSAWWYFSLAYVAAALMYCIVEKPFATLRELVMAKPTAKASS